MSICAILESLRKNYLAKKSFSGKEYEHALNVLKKIEVKRMKEYHDLYLKSKVLLLADVFGTFRNNSLKNYGLCPSHYFSAPGLSLDAMIKMTKINFELNSDPDMYIFFGKGKRGRISYVSNRYSKANNKYLKSFNSKQEAKNIIYLDVNNIYVYAMSKFLPTSGFK